MVVDHGFLRTELLSLGTDATRWSRLHHPRGAVLARTASAICLLGEAFRAAFPVLDWRESFAARLAGFTIRSSGARRRGRGGLKFDRFGRNPSP